MNKDLQHLETAQRYLCQVKLVRFKRSIIATLPNPQHKTKTQLFNDEPWLQLFFETSPLPGKTEGCNEFFEVV